jgi:hypothetical protein
MRSISRCRCEEELAASYLEEAPGVASTRREDRLRNERIVARNRRAPSQLLQLVVVRLSVLHQRAFQTCDIQTEGIGMEVRLKKRVAA